MTEPVAQPPRREPITPPTGTSKTQPVTAVEAQRYVSGLAAAGNVTDIVAHHPEQLAIPRLAAPSGIADPTHPMSPELVKDTAVLVPFMNAYIAAYGLDQAEAAAAQRKKVGTQHREKVQQQMSLINPDAANFVRVICALLAEILESQSKAQLVSMEKAAAFGEVAVNVAEEAGKNTKDAMEKQGTAGLIGGSIGVVGAVGCTIGAAKQANPFGNEKLGDMTKEMTALQDKATLATVPGAGGFQVGQMQPPAAAGMAAPPVQPAAAAGGAPPAAQIVAQPAGAGKLSEGEQSRLEYLRKEVPEVKKGILQQWQGFLQASQGIMAVSQAAGQLQAAEPQAAAQRRQGFMQALFAGMNQGMKSAENQAQAYSSMTQSIAQSLAQMIRAGYIT